MQVTGERYNHQLYIVIGQQFLDLGIGAASPAFDCLSAAFREGIHHGHDLILIFQRVNQTSVDIPSTASQA